jgi:hypothetical protein
MFRLAKITILPHKLTIHYKVCYSQVKEYVNQYMSSITMLIITAI